MIVMKMCCKGLNNALNYSVGQLQGHKNCRTSAHQQTFQRKDLRTWTIGDLQRGCYQ